MNGDFELVERDGLARICRLETAHGTVETPAILPVINPNRQTVSAVEMRSEFGISMVITNSYIIYRNRELQERALKEGVHRLIDFDGAVMTDSGTFQTHVYSDVSVDPLKILEFQRAIGSDVATAFDVFSEPDFTRGRASEAAEITLARVREAIGTGKKGGLVAATVQGSLYSDIREKAARDLSAAGADYFSIGGVVPLMENYRFRDLVEVIVASKKGIVPGRPVHLFGAGHPLMLPLAVLLGCDIFDSASYVKYAYDGRMMFPEGSYSLADIRHSWCNCPVCISHSPSELRAMAEDERVKCISRHNLYTLTSELKRIKQAIHEGSMWNLVEERARSVPQLHDAYVALLRHQEFLGRFEPLSRRAGINFVDFLSLQRPAVRMFQSAASAVRPGGKEKLLVVKGERQYLTHFDFRTAAPDEDVASLTGLGIFPLQLTESYPLAQSTYSSSVGVDADPDEYARNFAYTSVRVADGRWKRDSGKMAGGSDGTPQVRAVASYQFGTAFTESLISGGVTCTFSKNTGKLRMVSKDGRQVLFFRTEDGLFSLKFRGGEIMQAALKPPRRRVICSDDASPFVSQGKSLFTRFVLDADESLRPGDECIVVDRSDRLLAVGSTLLTRDEMLSFRKGVAVNIREGMPSSASAQQPEGMR